MFARNTDMIGLMAAMSGQLDPALMLLSETQANLVGSRKGNAGIVDAIGALALENEAPASVRPSFSSGVFAKIEAYEITARKALAAAQAAGQALDELLSLPQPLRDICLDAAGETGWAFVGPGLKSMRLNTGGALPARLMRIEPGQGAPHHDHTGAEYTLVVKGAFCDGTGYFGVGDLSIKRPGQIHHPIAQGIEPCLALTVEEGGVAFTGVLGMLQRLFTRH